MADYNQYRNRQREVCKGITAEGREARQHLIMTSPAEKEGDSRIGSAVAGQEDPALPGCGSIRHRSTRSEAVHTEDAPGTFPKNLRTWVADRAAEGDARAAAQFRGWRYADQRNQRRLDARLEANALHIGPSPENDEQRRLVRLRATTACSPTESNRLLPTRSPRPASGQSTARPATCPTHSTGKFPSSTADASSPCSTRIRPPSSSDWRWPSRNTDRASRVTAAWSGSGWSQECGATRHLRPIH